MIGSRRKVNLIKKDFLEKKLCTVEEWDKLYTPIGIEFEAVTLQEIALSVITEIVCVFKEYNTSYLKSISR